MSKYRNVLKEVINVTSTNRGLCTLQHAVATYEQTKKGLSHFFSERNVQQDELHTRPLIYNYRLFNILCQYLWVTYFTCFCCHF